MSIVIDNFFTAAVPHMKTAYAHTGIHGKNAIPHNFRTVFVSSSAVVLRMTIAMKKQII